MPPSAAAAAAAALAVWLLAASCAACPPMYFRCANGECVKEDSVCNTKPDCGDGSDEVLAMCSNRTCGSGQFACRSPGHCIPDSRRCDDFPDCARSDSSDKSDEKDCLTIKKTDRHCGLGEFTCTKKLDCIEDKYVCDGANDCEDKSDEEMCGGDCRGGEFRCADGKCIDNSLLCNSRIDCSKGEDELNCTMSKCKFKTEFHCRMSGVCISNIFVCDGASETQCRHDDEICPIDSKYCRSRRYWTCKSGRHCVPKAAVCDGHVHCPDHSDELDCPLTQVAPRPCPAHMHRCNGTFDHCVSISQVCLGRQACPQPDSVVAAACQKLLKEQNPCARNNGGCHQLCRADLSDGRLRPVCSCRPGFSVDPNDASGCVDEDECQQFGACSQKCANTHGSFRCSCRRGYSLHGNSCRANRPPTVLLSTVASIQILAAGQRRLVLDGLTYPNFLTPDARRGLVFFFSRDGSISQVAFNGSGFRRLAENLLVDALALDWSRQLLFFSSPRLRANSGSVGVLNVTSGRRVTLLQLNCPRGMAVHPGRGLLFTAETCGERSGLYSFRLDGTRRRRLPVNVGTPIQLTIDFEQRPQRLYWTDTDRGGVFSCQLSGHDLRVHRRGDEAPHAIATVEDKLYWTDPAAEQLYSVRKFSKEQLRLEAKASGLLSVATSHQLLQPRLPAPPCDCGHVCLAFANDANATCLCDELHDLQEATGECVLKKQLSWPSLPPAQSSRDAERRLPTGAVAGVVVACLTGCVLLLALVAAVWRRRRQSQPLAYFANESYCGFSKVPPYSRMASDQSEVEPHMDAGGSQR